MASLLAQSIPSAINQYGCTYLNLGLRCNQTPGDMFAELLPAASAIFGAFLFFMLVIYGLVLVSRSHKEEAVGEAFNAYGNALFAAFIAAFAGLLSDAFVLGGGLPDTAPVVELLTLFKDFLLSFAYAALAANIAIQSIRLLVAQSDTGTDAARTNLVRSIIGAFLLNIANLTILDLRPSKPERIIDVFIGVANFAATLFGAMAVIGMIAAGIMLVISVDESLKDRAKKLIITSIAALIVVLLAKGIATFFEL
ncbi:MAG TPA: hypothetical protein VI913_01805 [Candidatus Peribacteraceae bacterium]|nr:hypothetical protein [Candidatus Peribacteraceae bacterium]